MMRTSILHQEEFGAKKKKFENTKTTIMSTAMYVPRETHFRFEEWKTRKLVRLQLIRSSSSSKKLEQRQRL